MSTFFDCHTHTTYSNIRLLDCINRPKELIDKAIELGLSGITITDHECLSAHMEVNKYAKKLQETNPEFIVALGNEIYLTKDRSSGQKYFHFILIAKNAQGYKALRELSSIAWTNSYVDRRLERVPTLKSELKEIIKKYPNSLIATSACMGGELSTYALESYKDNSFYEKIKEFVQYCLDLFGDDFYIECAPASTKDQVLVNQKLLEIAETFKIKMVMGSDAHYLTEEDRIIHKSYLNSKDGEREVDAFYEFTHLMSYEEAENLLTEYSFKDPEITKWIFENTNEIKNKIEFYSLEKKQIIPKVEVIDYKKGFIPYEWFNKYPVLCSLISSDEIQERYWVNECIQALQNKNLYNDEYLKRLEIEADIIKYIGNQLNDCLFAYFNTFKHYIDLFWECGSIVGPGRGSATGFLSNWLLSITQLDPIRWELPYYRFLNKERAELPES